MGRVKRIWYLSPMRAAKVRRAWASAQSRHNLRCSLIQAVSQEEPSDKKARSLTPLNGWACAVEICHDGMLEGTNSLDAALGYGFRRFRQHVAIPYLGKTVCPSSGDLVSIQKDFEIVRDLNPCILNLTLKPLYSTLKLIAFRKKTFQFRKTSK